MTTSSLRLAKWLAEYATLMRLIRSEVRHHFQNLCLNFDEIPAMV